MEKENHKKGNNRWIFVLAGSLLLVVAVVLILMFLMQGSSSSTDNGGTSETVESLSCEGEKADYPYFKHADGVDKKSTKVNATFNNDKLNTISFTYKISYNDKNKSHDELERVRTENYFDVTKEFEDSGLTVEALGIRFSTLDDGVQMSLYTDSKGLSNLSSKFFLLDSANGSYKISNLKKLYENMGMKCTMSKN